jgi:hypothetical protein
MANNTIVTEELMYKCRRLNCALRMVNINTTMETCAKILFVMDEIAEKGDQFSIKDAANVEFKLKDFFTDTNQNTNE